MRKAEEPVLVEVFIAESAVVGIDAANVTERESRSVSV
jgi:hypothetical protein